jgi:phosphoribosylformylglycinamidine synthase subunit PurS
MRFAAAVEVRLKEGVADPQGATIERSLPALGFEGVHEVRIGRLVELETDDPDSLPALCEKLLANPLIEDFEIVPASGDGSSSPTPGPSSK